jgi:hypothetical protein
MKSRRNEGHVSRPYSSHQASQQGRLPGRPCCFRGSVRHRLRSRRKASMLRMGIRGDTSPQNGCCKGTLSSSAGTLAESAGYIHPMRKMRRLQVPVGEPIENRRLRVKIIGSGLLYGNFAVYVRKRIESKGSRRGGFFRADPSHASKGGSRGNPGTRRTLRCGGRQGSALRSARCAARSTIPHEQRPLVREPWPTRGLD